MWRTRSSRFSKTSITVSSSASIVARLYGNHRHAQHAAQTAVIEFRAAVLQLVEHVERHDHARVYINQFGS